MLQVLELDDRELFRCPDCGAVYEFLDPVTNPCCVKRNAEMNEAR